MSKAGRETEDVGIDRVPAYLPQCRLPQAQLVFPTEASMTPAVPAAPPRAGTCTARTCRQAGPIPHSGSCWLGHVGATGPCPTALPHTAPTPCSRSLSHTGNHRALASLPQTDWRSPGSGHLSLHQQSIITEHVCTLPGRVLTALYVPIVESCHSPRQWVLFVFPLYRKGN